MKAAELMHNGVGISQMPTDRLTQSFHEMCAEYAKRGLYAADYLPDVPLAPELAEAVEAAEKLPTYFTHEFAGVGAYQKIEPHHIRTLLRHVRAQRPGLTEGQVKILREACMRLDNVSFEENIGEPEDIAKSIRAAFPAAFR